VRNVKQHNNTQGLGAYTDAQLKAELESRKSATHGDVYERAGCSDDEHREQLDAFFEGVSRGVSITAMSTRGNPEFISGNVKNYSRKLGNLTGVREILGMSEHVEDIGDEPDALSVCREYLQSRKDGGTGFTTRMFLEQIGTYKGKPFGVVVKDDNVGTRYVIGALRKDDPQAFKHTTAVYRNVEKATKGQRMKVDYLVFDPVG